MHETQATWNNQAVQIVVKHRFGKPFQGVEFSLDLDQRLVVVRSIKREPPMRIIKAAGEFVLYVGEIDDVAYRNRIVPLVGFDLHHLMERCQAITALHGLRVEFKDHEIVAPQDA